MLVIAIGVVMALEQLGLTTAFAITFGALMLGFPIAFGLRGQAAAKILLEEQFRAKKKRDIDAAPHLWLDGQQLPTSNSQLPNALSRRCWELGIWRWELTRSL